MIIHIRIVLYGVGVRVDHMTHGGCESVMMGINSMEWPMGVFDKLVVLVRC